MAGYEQTGTCCAVKPFVLHLIYHLIRGGTEGQCARVAMGLKKRGGKHQVAVFKRQGYFLPRVERVCGPVFHVRISRVIAVNTWVEVIRLARFIKQERVHCLHCWDADSAIFGSLAARWARVPYVTSRRDLGQIYPPWKLRWMRWADVKARRIIINADAIRREWGEDSRVRDRLVLIPNLLDVDEFDRESVRPFSKDAQLPRGRLLVMTVRLDPEKDIQTAIEAFALIADRFPDTYLVLAGDGPERDPGQMFARRLGISERVVFLGEIEDVPALLKKATIGLMVPSRNEGLSNSILEYFAACLPVIATDCGGNRELIESSGAGIVVPPRSPRAVADACAALLADPDRAQHLGNAGRRKVEKEHHPAIVLDQFEQLYENIVSKADE